MQRHLTLALLLALTACDRRERFAAPDTTAAPPPPAALERIAYLSISDLSPRVGSMVVVAGNVRIDDSLSVASFRVRLGYDDTALSFLDEIAVPGGMRVVNPQAREIIVAGASAEGSRDGTLFLLRFRVNDPAGLGSLVLAVDELNDARYASHTSALTRSSKLVLDQKLALGRKAPQ